MAEAEAAAPAAKEPEAPSAPKGPMLIALVNSLAIMGALGTFAYTRVIYQRPKITEEGERARIANQAHGVRPANNPGLVSFEPLTVNIRPSGNKLHYSQIGMSMEMADISKQDTLDLLKPILIDRILSLVGRKTYDDLTTVQGRYVLRTQIVDAANDLIQKESKDKSIAVTNVYFANFIVQ